MYNNELTTNRLKYLNGFTTPTKHLKLHVHDTSNNLEYTEHTKTGRPEPRNSQNEDSQTLSREFAQGEEVLGPGPEPRVLGLAADRSSVQSIRANWPP